MIRALSRLTRRRRPAAAPTAFLIAGRTGGRAIEPPARPLSLIRLERPPLRSASPHLQAIHSHKRASGKGSSPTDGLGAALRRLTVWLFTRPPRAAITN